MGLFGMGRGGGSDMMSRLLVARAISEGDYGTAMQYRAQLEQQAARQRQAEAEAEQEAQERAQAAGAMEAHGYDKSAIMGMNPDDISALMRETYQPRQFGPEGGSVMIPGMAPGGAPSFQRAPSQFTDQGRMIQVEPDGSGRQTFDAREGDIDWQTGPWGAFATDRTGRPLPPGSNIQSPMDLPGATPPIAAPQPQASPTGPAGDGVSFRDPLYDQLEAGLEQEYGLPRGLMSAIRTRGERSNANQVSEAGAQTVYQIIPDTARAFANRYGVNAYSGNPEDAARVAALHLRESMERHGDPNRAVLEYHGGTDERNWGPRTRAYAQRVGSFGGGEQFAQASMPPMAGQGPSVQEQAAGGFVRAPEQAPPGMMWGQGGSLIPRAGSEQQYNRERNAQTDTDARRREAAGVLDGFRRDPQVQQFNAIRTATLQAQQLAQSNNPADQVALIFSFMRALDPNSTVREGEVAMARDTAGVPDQIRNMYNQAASGRALNPQQVRAFVRTMESLYRSRAGTYNEVARGYREQLQSIGMPSDQVGRMVPIARGTEQQYRQEMARRRPGQAAANGLSGTADRTANRSIRIIRRRPVR